MLSVYIGYIFADTGQAKPKYCHSAKSFAFIKIHDFAACLVWVWHLAQGHILGEEYGLMVHENRVFRHDELQIKEVDEKCMMRSFIICVP